MEASIRKRRSVLWTAFWALLGVELLHAVLNRVANPLTGPLDLGLHVLMWLTALAVILASTYFGHRVFMAFGTRFSNISAHPSLPYFLMVLVAIYLTSQALLPARTGSSSYHVLPPDVLGGWLLGVLTFAVGQQLFPEHRGRMLIFLVAWLWMVGSTVVDLLWLTERTSRGVGPLWHIPLFSSWVAGAAICLFLLGVPAYLLAAPVFMEPIGVAARIGWGLVLVAALTLLLLHVSKTPKRVHALALASSMVFLLLKLVEWAGFISD